MQKPTAEHPFMQENAFGTCKKAYFGTKNVSFFEIAPEDTARKLSDLYLKNGDADLHP